MCVVLGIYGWIFSIFCILNSLYFLVKSVNVYNGRSYFGFGKNSSTFLRAAPCDMIRDITLF